MQYRESNWAMGPRRGSHDKVAESVLESWEGLV